MDYNSANCIFKSLSGQIERVQKGKSFIVFDGGKNTSCKPISASDLSKYIIQEMENKNSYKKILTVGGPGPSMSQFDQGQIKLIDKQPKFRSIPKNLFLVLIILCFPLSFVSRTVANFRRV